MFLISHPLRNYQRPDMRRQDLVVGEVLLSLGYSRYWVGIVTNDVVSLERSLYVRAVGRPLIDLLFGHGGRFSMLCICMPPSRLYSGLFVWT